MIVCWIYLIYSKKPKCHLRASIFQNFPRRHAPDTSITHNQKLQLICVNMPDLEPLYETLVMGMIKSILLVILVILNQCLPYWGVLHKQTSSQAIE